MCPWMYVSLGKASNRKDKSVKAGCEEQPAFRVPEKEADSKFPFLGMIFFNKILAFLKKVMYYRKVS